MQANTKRVAFAKGEKQGVGNMIKRKATTIRMIIRIITFQLRILQTGFHLGFFAILQVSFSTCSTLIYPFYTFIISNFLSFYHIIMS